MLSNCSSNFLKKTFVETPHCIKVNNGNYKLCNTTSNIIQFPQSSFTKVRKSYFYESKYIPETKYFRGRCLVLVFVSFDT